MEKCFNVLMGYLLSFKRRQNGYELRNERISQSYKQTMKKKEIRG